ncbi:hypothetical protein RP726_05330 [Candidatus Methylospira mobilis]|nr:hypothetical protein [Candidatus Methylospira mobilis]WNV05839.1 hypothetical protein RP726_05330 [Candidatus Methylospira mobilis]
MAGAAEGKVVANLFAPAGDWDVPAGFAKNGDTLLIEMVVTASLETKK